MPKKLKLNLDDLRVQSFVTDLGEKDRKRIMGGWTTLQECNCTGNCSTALCTQTCGPTCFDCHTNEVMACDPFTAACDTTVEQCG